MAKRGFKSALVRPIIAQGKYPTFPEFNTRWREFEELGMVLGMHTFPSRGEAMSPELGERMGANRKRLFGDEDLMVYSPGQFVANIMQIMGSKQAGDAADGFIAEAMTWTGVVLMTGWLEKFPRLKVAILESNSSWGLLLGVGEGRDYSRPLQTFRRESAILRACFTDTASLPLKAMK